MARLARPAESAESAESDGWEPSGRGRIGSGRPEMFFASSVCAPVGGDPETMDWGDPEVVGLRKLKIEWGGGSCFK